MSDTPQVSACRAHEKLGVVVIGRNEGERLQRCLASLAGSEVPVVYADSGSSDGSVALARQAGAGVVELEPDRPFTMARGRNAGFQHLLQLHPALELVQFVDGDCEVVEGWLETARRELERRDEVGLVCGRRREREREGSIYNRVTDMEWDGPAGEVAFAGGDVMMRADVFRQVGGYREDLIAGEDPEICVRIRQAGWKILRLEVEMTRHDAAIHRFSQWWRRSVRGGHAYAEVAHLCRCSADPTWRRESRSILLWGLFVPLLAIAGSLWTHGATFAAFVLYPIWSTRIALKRRREYGNRWSDCLLYGGLCMLGKVPQMIGQSMFVHRRQRGRRADLIEYKNIAGSAVERLGS